MMLVHGMIEYIDGQLFAWGLDPAVACGAVAVIDVGGWGCC
jgi:hypothetical protein